MSPWLLRLLGLDPGEIPPGGVTSFELSGAPSGLWGLVSVVIAGLAVALVLLLYRRERELSAPRRLLLTALRLLALSVVILVLLNPRLRVEVQARRLAETLVLVDGSGSMSTRDRYGPQEREALRRATGLDPLSGPQGSEEGRSSRSELVAAALERTHLVERLGKKNGVRAFVFGEGASAVEGKDLPRAVRAAPASGKSTWLGSALRETLETGRTVPIAGVVLLSDGKSNGGDPLAGALSELESRRIPVHTLLVGAANAPKNLAIAELNAPEVAEAGMPIKIRVRLRGSGYPGEFEVKLLRSAVSAGAGSGGAGSAGVAQPVASEKVQLKESESEEVLNLTDLPPKDGRYRYTALVDPQAGEESTRDNRRTAEVMVAGEKCRVLLVAGGPSYLYHFLRKFFIRDPGIQASIWLQGADSDFPQDGDLPIKRCPATAAELRPYDVVFLLDPDLRALPTGFTEALETFVTEIGGGLAFVAGEHHTHTLGESPEGARLLSLLPVELERTDPGHDFRRVYRAELTSAGRGHTLCQLRNQASENQVLWQTLPRFRFRFPVKAVKPAAQTLLSLSGSAVAAVHQAGAGRSFFLATDELGQGLEHLVEVHEQFWSGAARYLGLGKRIAGTRQVSIGTDRERYGVGDEVRVEIHLLDAEHQPVVAPRVNALLERAAAKGAEEEEGDAGGAGASTAGSAAPERPGLERPGLERPGLERIELVLTAVSGRPGFFRASWKSDAVGLYRVTLADQGAEGQPAAFTVRLPLSELEDAAPEPGTLRELAQRTQGTFGPLSRLDAIPDLIPDRTVVEVLGRKTRTVWDSAFLLLLFSSALVLEWILRKKWRLM